MAPVIRASWRSDKRVTWRGWNHVMWCQGPSTWIPKHHNIERSWTKENSLQTKGPRNSLNATGHILDSWCKSNVKTPSLPYCKSCHMAPPNKHMRSWTPQWGDLEQLVQELTLIPLCWPHAENARILRCGRCRKGTLHWTSYLKSQHHITIITYSFKCMWGLAQTVHSIKVTGAMWT